MFSPGTFTADNFNVVYGAILEALKREGTKAVNRKGDTIVELFDASFRIENPMNCLAVRRDLSMEYLEKEMAFYMGGSDSLEDAMKMSKFWKKCSDDGKTINSNYGKLIFHDKNSKGNTQFQHAIDCLCNNLQSKKAVMTLYNAEHAYISNDNPCTMYLRARIDDVNKVHLSTYMRSSDVYFGLPYDVPFFCFVLYAVVRQMNERYFSSFEHASPLSIGTYTHHASSLHYYESKEKEINAAIVSQKTPNIADQTKVIQLFRYGYRQLKDVNFNPHEYFMRRAWEEASKAKCLKKKVGACFAYNIWTSRNNEGAIAWIKSLEIAAHWGGVNGEPCTECVREYNKNPDNKEKNRYYGDECPSVHAEMWCVKKCYEKSICSFSDTTVYVTHGPCDACLKLLDLVGVKNVIYDKPYKTDYSHWPNINIQSLEEVMRNERTAELIAQSNNPGDHR